MLFDVAAVLYEVGFRGSIDAMLLLPEVFENLPYPEGMRPIAYGTLVELAALAAGRVALPVMKAERPLFGRVYLHGRAALTPDEAYESVASTLEAMSLASVRLRESAPKKAVPKPSVNAFSTAAKASLRLMRHRELAEIAAGAFLRDLVSARPSEISPTEVAANLVEKVEAAHRARLIVEEVRSLDDDRIDSFPSQPEWFAALFDESKWLTDARRRVESDVRSSFGQLAKELASRPSLFERLLAELALLLPSLRSSPGSTPPVGLIEELRGLTDSWFARRFHLPRIRAVKRRLLVELRKEREKLLAQAVLMTAIDVVNELLEKERRHGAALDDLYALWERSNQWDGLAEQILRQSLSEMDRGARDTFEARLRELYARYSVTRDTAGLQGWIEATRDLLDDTFRSRFVDPALLPSADVKAAIRQLDPGVFDPARASAPAYGRDVAASARLRSGRFHSIGIRAGAADVQRACGHRARRDRERNRSRARIARPRARRDPRDSQI